MIAAKGEKGCWEKIKIDFESRSSKHGKQVTLRADIPGKGTR